MTHLTSRHLAPIQKSNVTNEVVTRLVDLILDENLKSGDRLPSERALTHMLQVGRTTLREAMKVLNALGMVKVSVGQGTFVGNGKPKILDGRITRGIFIGERSTQELMEARGTIETELARLAAERATDDQVAAIAEQLNLQADAVDEESYIKHDLEFHLCVARAAHNRVMYRMFEAVRQLLRMVIMDSIVIDSDRQRTLARHTAIYEAIRARDTVAARNAMRDHLDDVSAEVLGKTTTTADDASREMRGS